MTGWPGQPVIYETNTAVWLDELARASGRPVTLADVAAADWDAAVPDGVDAVWLMGACSGLFVDLGPWQSHLLALQ